MTRDRVSDAGLARQIGDADAQFGRFLLYRRGRVAALLLLLLFALLIGAHTLRGPGLRPATGPGAWLDLAGQPAERSVATASG